MNLTLPAAAVLLVFATTASADDVYKGLAEGNPELGEPHPQADSPTNLEARRTGTDEIDMHHGLSEGNPDLSPAPGSRDDPGTSTDHSDVDLHGGFSGNPDLSPPPPQQ
jgi:hypothetical protein